MSIFWTTDRVGYDGDCLYGSLKINYWQEPERVKAEIEKQLTEIKDEMLAEASRLVADD